MIKNINNKKEWVSFHRGDDWTSKIIRWKINKINKKVNQDYVLLYF